MDNNLNIGEEKREYLDFLLEEIRQKGYSVEQAQYVIDKSDFISLMDKHTDCVMHESISHMADDLIKKTIFCPVSE